MARRRQPDSLLEQVTQFLVTYIISLQVSTPQHDKQEEGVASRACHKVGLHKDGCACEHGDGLQESDKGTAAAGTLQRILAPAHLDHLLQHLISRLGAAQLSHYQLLLSPATTSIRIDGDLLDIEDAHKLGKSWMFSSLLTDKRVSLKELHIASDVEIPQAYNLLHTQTTLTALHLPCLDSCVLEKLLHAASHHLCLLQTLEIQSTDEVSDDSLLNLIPGIVIDRPQGALGIGRGILCVARSRSHDRSVTEKRCGCPALRRLVLSCSVSVNCLKCLLQHLHHLEELDNYRLFDALSEIVYDNKVHELNLRVVSLGSDACCTKLMRPAFLKLLPHIQEVKTDAHRRSQIIFNYLNLRSDFDRFRRRFSQLTSVCHKFNIQPVVTSHGSQLRRIHVDCVDIHVDLSSIILTCTALEDLLLRHSDKLPYDDEPDLMYGFRKQTTFHPLMCLQKLNLKLCKDNLDSVWIKSLLVSPLLRMVHIHGNMVTDHVMHDVITHAHLGQTHTTCSELKVFNLRANACVSRESLMLLLKDDIAIEWICLHDVLTVSTEDIAKLHRYIEIKGLDVEVTVR